MSRRTAGIVARPDKAEALNLAVSLMDRLRERGLSVMVEKSVASYIGQPEIGTDMEKMKANFLVVIGGDGTVLRVCKSIPTTETPIIVINFGTKGFLADVKPKMALKIIDDFLEGRYFIERCTKLSITLNDERLSDALNEVLIVALQPFKALNFEVCETSSPPLSCYADGILISTTLGSTAHSLSAGGPIVHPRLQAMVVTPLSPLSPFHPIVFPLESEIKVRITRADRKAIVIIDGEREREMSTEDKLLVRKSKHSASFIRFDKTYFYDRLKKRMVL
jgi:NAD+ kinase